MRKQTFISYAGTNRFPAPVLKEVFQDFVVFRSKENACNYAEYALNAIPVELLEKPWNKYVD